MGVCREATRTIRGNRESRGTIVPPREHQNIDWVAKRETMTAMQTMKSVGRPQRRGCAGHLPAASVAAAEEESTKEGLKCTCRMNSSKNSRCS